ncbi:MAG: hypothetical protein AB7K24_25270 [Gemmataceae bacterium]
MMGLKRREFVKVGAGSALLLGLPCARGEELARLKIQGDIASVPVVPTDWKQFHAEMKKRNQPGVVVLLQSLPTAPSLKGAAAPAQQAQAEALKQLSDVHVNNDMATLVHNSLFNCGDSELPLLLVQAVFVAAPAAEVHKQFPALPARAGLALIGAEGKVLASMPLEHDLGQKFADRAAQLIYGKDGTMLAERVRAERAALGAAACAKLDAAITDLDNDDFNLRQQASQTLAGLFPQVQATLAQAHRDAKSMEVRVRIDTLFRKKLHDANTAALFQRSLAPHVAAAANFNIRVMCGQGSLLPQAHEFVQRWCAAKV